MGKIVLSVWFAFLALLLAGCGMKSDVYSVSADNVVRLREFSDIKVNIGNFTADSSDENHILCRLGDTITTPMGEPFELYIQKAFEEEFKMAGIYSKNANITITGHLNSINGFSAPARWNIDMTVSSNTGKSFKVFTSKRYPSVYSGNTACNNMAREFMPAVRQFINEVVNNNDFAGLLKNPEQVINNEELAELPKSQIEVVNGEELPKSQE